jgi:D-3-phosphoglycerate dehydrogenase / 2-oxoglutarate reductase
VSRPTIVATGPVPASVREQLAPLGELIVAESDDFETLAGLMGEAVGVIARAASRIDRRLLDAAPRLRVIGRSGVGTDAVDLAAASERGIPVVVTPGANADAVAEGTIAFLLALVKRLPQFDRAVRSGDWAARDREPPGDVAGSTLVVVGLGGIGRRVARLAGLLGMEVLASDPCLEQPPSGVEATLLPLDEALRRADHVTLHVPLTAQTAGLITGRRLALAQPGLRLVNASRGGVAPLGELLAALEAGVLGGVALDVYDEEPPDLSHPIFARPEVLCAPHVLGLSMAARDAIFSSMTEGMVRVLGGQRAAHVANPEVYSD